MADVDHEFILAAKKLFDSMLEGDNTDDLLSYEDFRDHIQVLLKNIASGV